MSVSQKITVCRALQKLIINHCCRASGCSHQSSWIWTVYLPVCLLQILWRVYM